MRAILSGLAIFAALPADAGERVVTRDAGGYVLHYANQVALAKNRGQGWRIEGECLSACTLYLGAPQTCVARGAVLGFHAPAEDDGRIAHRWVPFMTMHYPARLRHWAEATEALQMRRMTYLTGAMVIALGARECPR